MTFVIYDEDISAYCNCSCCVYVFQLLASEQFAPPPQQPIVARVLSVCLSVCLYVCMYVCMYVIVFVE